MLLKSTLSITALLLVLGTSCTDDKKKIEEPVAASAATETPAAPSGDVPVSTELKTAPIYFGFDDYTLSPEAQSTLTAMAEAMKASKSAAIQIEGHCDERGTVEYNLALGERRAQSVKNFLSQLGVDGARLSTISYGEEKPVVQGHSEDAWAKNRRAEFVVTNN
jgi:peptidoglycan-associated lipoprotein